MLSTLLLAIGLVMILSGLGNLVAPPLGNSLARIDLGLPFAFWAGLSLLGFLGLYFTTETKPVSPQVEAAALAQS